MALAAGGVFSDIKWSAGKRKHFAKFDIKE
jgi:hypothetical protein